MKKNIHPDYHKIKVVMTDGTEFETRSTRVEDLHIDVCSECHPFYTGKQRVMDTGGRVDKFKKRFGSLGKK